MLVNDLTGTVKRLKEQVDKLDKRLATGEGTAVKEGISEDSLHCRSLRYLRFSS